MIAKLPAMFGLAALMFAATSASAAEPAGVLSGPAAGTPVLPSTVVQKLPDDLQQGRSVDVEFRRTPSAACGLPGVEGLPGTESGRVPADVSNGERR